MKKLLLLEFEGLPPTANTMYRNSGSRRYKRQEVQDWQNDIAGLMSEQWNDRNNPILGGLRLPFRRRVQVSIEFTTKDKRNCGI